MGATFFFVGLVKLIFKIPRTKNPIKVPLYSKCCCCIKKLSLLTKNICSMPYRAPTRISRVDKILKTNYDSLTLNLVYFLNEKF